MDLNTFGTETIKQLTRIADALENRPVAAATDAKPAVKDEAPAKTEAPAKDEAPAKTTRSRAKPAAKKEDAPAKPKYSRDEVNAALIALKDECGKEFAQEVIRDAGYTKMAEIEEKDFDTVYAAAKAKHEEMANADLDDEDDM